MAAKKIIVVVFSLLLASTVLGRKEPTVRWGRQILTPTDDGLSAAQMVVDSNGTGNIYLVRLDDKKQDTPAQEHASMAHTSTENPILDSDLTESCGGGCCGKGCGDDTVF